jgi:hypothetical protein
MLSFLAGLAHAGDVWFTVDARTRTGAVRLDLPAAVLGDGPNTLTVGGQPVDLQTVITEVAAMAEGGSRALDGTIEGGTAHVVVEHRAAATRAPTRLRVSGIGPEGRGIDLTLALDGSALGTATTSQGVRVQGLSLELRGDGVADAIRRGKPTLLVDLVSPDGGRLKIESQ